MRMTSMFGSVRTDPPQTFVSTVPDYLLMKAVDFMSHKPGCCISEWPNGNDHFRTSFGFLVNAEECSCGAIVTAMAVERKYYGGASIPEGFTNERP